MSTEDRTSRKLRIRSDGTGPGTTIEAVPQDGSAPVRLDNVLSATWTARWDELATATLTFVDVEVDVTGEEKQ
jgi:hypothetical protein